MMKILGQTIAILIAVIVILFAVCYVVSCNTNEAITKGMSYKRIAPDSISGTKQDSTYYQAYQKAFNQLREDNEELISNCVQSWNSNMTLWMSLICAVCTLLPIASNLYYSTQMKAIEDRFMEQINSENEKFKEQIDKFKEEINSENKKFKEEIDKFKADKEKLMHDYDIIRLSSTINTLCDIQDLFQSHSAMLTDTHVVEKSIALLSRFKDESSRMNFIPAKDKIEDHLKSSYYFLLCNYGKLLTTYESVFEYPRLMSLFGIQADIKNLLLEFNEADLKKIKTDIESITSRVISLFQEEMKERKSK